MLQAPGQPPGAAPGALEGADACKEPGHCEPVVEDEGTGATCEAAAAEDVNEGTGIEAPASELAGVGEAGPSRMVRFGRKGRVGEDVDAEGRELSALSMRELRKMCAARGIDTTSCLDKADFIARLEVQCSSGSAAGGNEQESEADPLGPEATGVPAPVPQVDAPVAGTPVAEPRPLDAPAADAAAADAPAADAPVVTPPAAAPSAAAAGQGQGDRMPPQPQPHHSGNATGSAAAEGRELSALSMRELRKMCAARGIDTTSCLDKADFIARLEVQCDNGNCCEATPVPQADAPVAGTPAAEPRPLDAPAADAPVADAPAADAPAAAPSAAAAGQAFGGRKRTHSHHIVEARSLPPPGDI